jgi:hypothetical protein
MALIMIIIIMIASNVVVKNAFIFQPEGGMARKEDQTA